MDPRRTGRPISWPPCGTASGRDSCAAIDAYRRQLQRNYLDLVNTKVNGPAFTLPAGLPAGFPMAIFASSGDEKPFYRAELRALSTSIAAALARTADRTTRVHLEGARDQIARILDPKFNPIQGAGAAEIRIFGDQWSGQSLSTSVGDPNAPWQQIEDCWPDYEIRP